jgi:hypothetical protein
MNRKEVSEPNRVSQIRTPVSSPELISKSGCSGTGATLEIAFECPSRTKTGSFALDVISNIRT